MSKKHLSSVPEKIQLPHGIQLRKIPFKILAYHDDGSPKTFEILPQNETSSDCFLFAQEEWIRSSLAK